jgi:hypothetical protein
MNDSCCYQLNWKLKFCCNLILIFVDSYVFGDELVQLVSYLFEYKCLYKGGYIFL